MLALIAEIKAVYYRRELLFQMIIREIKAQHKQSMLGFFWVILNPPFSNACYELCFFDYS